MGVRPKYNNGQLQTSLLDLLFVTLDLISDLESVPVVEAETAFVAFAHLRDVLLHVFE